ncbi:MAG: hypothetical protein E3J87_01160 [Candidatus Cloacimonadota bacterium]|nr:MAG: hypothetical protein E3J87_01160 [Candidatus Cloacimonadota bacterium]
MIKKILFLVCIAVLLLSFTVERAEARPRWWGPPWAWGYYEVNYYHWYPYYSYSYYSWYPWWYDDYYYWCYWGPSYYCYYSPGWYVSFWGGWGHYPYYYPYYCYYPYGYYYPPYYNHYYAYYDYYYPDYYWDGYGRWRDYYYDGHKPYRTGNYGGGGKDYAYNNWKDNSKPPRDYGKDKDRMKIGNPTHKDHNLEIAKVDPIKSIRSIKRSENRTKTPSINKQPLSKEPTIRRKKETRGYEPIEVVDDHISGVSERELSKGSSKRPYKDYEKKEDVEEEKFTPYVIRRNDEKKKKKEDNKSEKKKVSNKKSEESVKRPYTRSGSSSPPKNRGPTSPGSKRGKRR